MYKVFESVAAAVQSFRRCRNTQWFILSDAAVQAENPVCAHCGKKLTELPKGEEELPKGYIGNRMVYVPRQKRVIAMHYVCSWNNLLGQIANLPHR